jgi:hypothetical protein
MANTRTWVQALALIGLVACGSSKSDSAGTGEAGAASAGGIGSSSQGGRSAASSGAAGSSTIAHAGSGANASGGSAAGGDHSNAAASGDAGRNTGGGAGVASGAGGASPGGANAGGANTGGASAGGASAGGANTGGAVSCTIGGEPGATLTSCATWTVLRSKSGCASIELTSSGVLFSRPGVRGDANDVFYNGDNIALAQGGLKGDFDIKVEFENFQPGSPYFLEGPEFEAGVFWRDAQGSLYQATGQLGESTAQAILINNHDFLQKLLDPTPNPNSLFGASASVEIKRESGMLTVIATLNGQSVSLQSSVPFSEEPLDFGIGIGSSGNTQQWKDSSVVLTSVTVNGGGGAVKSDTFDCLQ